MIDRNLVRLGVDPQDIIGKLMYFRNWTGKHDCAGLVIGFDMDRLHVCYLWGDSKFDDEYSSGAGLRYGSVAISELEKYAIEFRLW
jgi:hypothetical protein